MTAIVLDFETSALDFDELDILEVGVTDLNGEVIFHALGKPQRMLTEDSKNFLCIDESEFKVSVSQTLILQVVFDLFKKASEVYIYNRDFDYGLLCHRQSKFGVFNSKVYCAMAMYQKYLGVEYRPRLPQMHKTGDAHSALTDCRSTAILLTHVLGKKAPEKVERTISLDF